MVLVIVAIFLVETVKVFNGKVDSMLYMIKNIEPDEQWIQTPDRIITLAVGIKSIYESQVTLQVKQKKSSNSSRSFDSYNCTDHVYKTLSYELKSDMPTDLSFRCIDTSTNSIHEYGPPTFQILKCKSQNCLSLD